LLDYQNKYIRHSKWLIDIKTFSNIIHYVLVFYIFDDLIKLFSDLSIYLNILDKLLDNCSFCIVCILLINKQ